MAAHHGLIGRFKSTIRQLDYPDTILDRDLSAIAGHPKCAILLEWLCENLSSDNVLAEEEIDRFESLRERQQILEGAALRDTLQEVKDACPYQDLTDDELRHSVASLEEEVALLSGAKQRLQSQHSVLSEQIRTCTRRHEQIQRLEERVIDQGKAQLNATKQQNKQMNIQLEDLLQSTRAAVAATTSLASPSTTPAPAPKAQGLMSTQDFATLHSKEELFMHHLTEYTKKQFKGIRSLAGTHEECHLLDTRDPKRVLLDGESPEAIAEACEELVRLRSVHVAGQLQLHLAEASVAKVTAASAHLEKKFALLRNQRGGGVRPSQDESAVLNAQLKEAQHAVVQLKKQIAELKDERLPAVLSELASLQDTHILSGNYQLKLSRQRYFLGKQSQLIDHLLEQRARHELLSMMLEIEERQHRQSERLLASLQSELQSCQAQFAASQRAGSSPCLQASDPGRYAVDAQDSTMTRLSALLATCDGISTADNQVILTYQHIQEQADKLSTLLSSQLSKLASHQHSHAAFLSKLEKSVSACDQSIASSGMDSGLPTMTIQELQKSMAELDNLLGILQRSVKDCLQQWGDKTKVLATDETEQQSRQLFSWFFTDPLKLELCIQHLRQQVDQ